MTATKKSTAVVKKSPAKKAVAKVTPESGEPSIVALMQMAIDKPEALQIIKELTALKNQEEDRFAKKEFDSHFAEMQKEYPPVARTKSVMNKDGSKELYKFCPLEDIQKVYAPIIAAHGFSYRFKETQKDDKTKTVTCIVSGYGHSEESPVDIPIMDGTAFTNNIQQRGVSTSYGKRYSFVNAFGVIIQGEDTDVTGEEDIPQSEDQELDAAKRVLANGFKAYKGEDKDELMRSCKEASKSGKFDMKFAQGIAGILGVEL